METQATILTDGCKNASHTLVILERTIFNERIDRFYTHRQKERNQHVRLRYARAGDSESHGSHGVHDMSRRATAVTRRVGSGSEAPARCPKDVEISAPLRDRFRYVQSGASRLACTSLATPRPRGVGPPATILCSFLALGCRNSRRQSLGQPGDAPRALGAVTGPAQPSHAMACHAGRRGPGRTSTRMLAGVGR